MNGYFSTEHRHCMFGAARGTQRLKRRLAERMHVAFPLRFGSTRSEGPLRAPRAATSAKPHMRSLKGLTLRVGPF